MVDTHLEINLRFMILVFFYINAKILYTNLMIFFLKKKHIWKPDLKLLQAARILLVRFGI
jgi:hypothetical protein